MATKRRRGFMPPTSAQQASAVHAPEPPRIGGAPPILVAPAGSGAPFTLRGQQQSSNAQMGTSAGVAQQVSQVSPAAEQILEKAAALEAVLTAFQAGAQPAEQDTVRELLFQLEAQVVQAPRQLRMVSAQLGRADHACLVTTGQALWNLALELSPHSTQDEQARRCATLEIALRILMIPESLPSAQPAPDGTVLVRAHVFLAAQLSELGCMHSAQAYSVAAEKLQAKHKCMDEEEKMTLHLTRLIIAYDQYETKLLLNSAAAALEDALATTRTKRAPHAARVLGNRCVRLGQQYLHHALDAAVSEAEAAADVKRCMRWASCAKELCAIAGVSAAALLDLALLLMGALTHDGGIKGLLARLTAVQAPTLPLHAAMLLANARRGRAVDAGIVQVIVQQVQEANLPHAHRSAAADLLSQAGDCAYSARLFDNAATCYQLAAAAQPLESHAHAALRASWALSQAGRPADARQTLLSDARSLQPFAGHALYLLLSLGSTSASLTRGAVHELKQHPLFEPTALLLLVEASLARGALDFTASILVALLGEARLSGALDKAQLIRALAHALSILSDDAAVTIANDAMTAICEPHVQLEPQLLPAVALLVAECFKLALAGPAIRPQDARKLGEATGTALMQNGDDPVNGCLFAQLTLSTVEQELHASLHNEQAAAALSNALDHLFQAQLQLARTPSGALDQLREATRLWADQIAAQICAQLQDWEGLRRCFDSIAENSSPPATTLSALEQVAETAFCGCLALPHGVAFLLLKRIVGVLLSTHLQGAGYWTKTTAYLRTLLRCVELAHDGHAPNDGALADVEDIIVKFRVRLGGHAAASHDLAAVSTSLWKLGMLALARGEAAGTGADTSASTSISDRLFGQALSMAALCDNAAELESSFGDMLG